MRQLSLEVPRGQTTVLLGESGSGKSTLLRLMAGLLAPDRGEILLEGAAVTPETGPALRRRMGFGLQSGGLFPHLTAADNVTLLSRALRRPAEWRARRLAELAGLVRLEPELLSRWPAQLSGGQRQRVSLMRALFLVPAVVLLDEPLGALDPVTRGELQGELRPRLPGARDDGGARHPRPGRGGDPRRPGGSDAGRRAGPGRAPRGARRASGGSVGGAFPRRAGEEGRSGERARPPRCSPPRRRPGRSGWGARPSPSRSSSGSW